MSYRTQHGQLSHALADEDARFRAAQEKRILSAAIAEYRRTRRVPSLPPRLLEQFTTQMFLTSKDQKRKVRSRRRRPRRPM